MHTAAHLRRQLFSLTSPIFVELLLIMLLSAVDVIMLSQHSDNAVAAVGVDTQILNMVFLVFEVFTAGTTVLCARYRGATAIRKTSPESSASPCSSTDFPGFLSVPPLRCLPSRFCTSWAYDRIS